MPTKTAIAPKAPKKREEPSQPKESIYEPQSQAPGGQFGFGVKLFLAAGLIILLFWFLNRSV